MRRIAELPVKTSPENYCKELDRLVEQFGRNINQYKSRVYDEASLRQEFLDPFFRALGWDVENKAGLIPQHREVEIESRTEIAGRKKRADYLFRTDRQDRFICEAKKPIEVLNAPFAFQAKRYAWNKGLVLAVLSDFEEMRIYVIGSKPHPEEEQIGLWRKWRFQEYPLVAQEIWDLLSRSSVAEGSIERLVDQLPRTPVGKGKARQQWLFKPDRTRTIDADFLNFLDEARRELASDLIRQNDRADLLEGTRLNEAVQRILDRLLFLRICEDRDIDTGRQLASILKFWRSNAEDAVPRRVRPSKFLVREDGGADDMKPAPAPRLSLWREVVAHFRALDHRPASQIPFFNGNLFKPHFSEDLIVGEEWLAGFLDEIGDEESAYLFNYIPVEILGIIYERFLGKIVRPQGRGVAIEEKPEVRKAGGVYYTPRYIVEYIVAQTVGKLLKDRTLDEALQLRILDPACGSGSFLIHAFEVVSEYCQQWLTDHRDKKKKDWYWVEENAVHLTAKAKRRILCETIHGVDIDPQAVEVTQLSLYLKMLEGENRTTLAREQELFGSDEALLPALEDNIKCGNSLIASDFSIIPDDLVRVHAFDWPVQFSDIMKAGGFDAVIGNPPYIQLSMEEFRDDQVNGYLKASFGMSGGRLNTFAFFIEKARILCAPKGLFGQIVPNTLLTQEYYEESRIRLVDKTHISLLTQPRGQVFGDAVVENIIVVALTLSPNDKLSTLSTEFADLTEKGLKNKKAVSQSTFTKNYKTSFIVPTEPGLAVLRAKLNCCQRKFGDCLNINQAIALKHDRAACLVQKKIGPAYHEILDGRHIGRYFTGESPNFFKFDLEKIHSCKRDDIFLAQEKIFMRRVGDSLIATLDRKKKFALNTLVVLTPKEGCGLGIRFLLGLLNSKLLNYFYTQFLKSTKKIFSEIQARQVAQLPIPLTKLDSPVNRANHDKLVALVDKMLALTPKLRAAWADAERKTLQNAVTATDRQIDALVYELYGLTKDEIKLVEGAS